MLYELIKEGYGEKQELNCAEKIIYGANEAYDLKIDEASLGLARGFGGGMTIGSTCGALTGGIMALSKRLTDLDMEKKELYSVIEEFLNEYEKRMGTIYCKELKEKYHIDDGGCGDIILEAAKLLDEMMEKYK